VKPPLCILTIAGSDSGGGAGIQADQAAIRAMGGHALTAVTAVTAQDTARVHAWRPVPHALVAAQVAAAFGGFAVAAAKTGLLPGAAAVRAVAAALRREARVPLVVDPVLASTSGTRFLGNDGVRALLDELVALASLVTPNWPEAEALGAGAVRTDAGARRACVRLSERIGRPVLLKGGHGTGRYCRDWLAIPGDAPTPITHRRIDTRNTHGTGCVLSAAIAARLGQGDGVAAAVDHAVGFLRGALARGRSADWRGRGPALAGGP
jgi:hydroxymethylpyrimidine/phosphomethylpyrimidine kinase